MTPQEINMDVLQQLTCIAMNYFAAICEINSTNGKCDFMPGKYYAKDMAAPQGKCPAKPYWQHPDNAEDICSVKAGTFECEFPRHMIFTILDRWETQMRAGKNKAVFEVGDVEQKTAKVLTSDKDAIGNYKPKSMKLQRIVGNWWITAKDAKKAHDCDRIVLYYELEDVMFECHNTYGDVARNEERKQWLRDHGRNILDKLIAKAEENEYFAEVCRRLGLLNAAEVEAAKERELTNAQNAEMERKQAEEDARRAELEREAEAARIERERRAELLADAKSKLLAGKYISVEQIELLAQNVGLPINPRTLGLFRDKVSEARILPQYGTPQFWGRGLNQRNIHGVSEVMRELFERIKAEEDASNAATAQNEPPQPPQIAEVDNAATDPQNEPINTLSEVERNFITEIESHKDAHGKIKAWQIDRYGSGKVIFAQSVTAHDGRKYYDYSCANVVRYADGGVLLDYKRPNYCNPFGRTIYKRWAAALRNFGMRAGRNGEIPAQLDPIPTTTETPQISMQAENMENVPSRAASELQRSNIKAAPNAATIAPQSPRIAAVGNCATPRHRHAHRPRIKPSEVCKQSAPRPSSRSVASTVATAAANAPPLLVSITEFAPYIGRAP